MITRRDLLKMASGAALGGPALAASESDLRAKARKNIKLAIFTGVYGRLTLDEAARRIKSDGFAGVALQTAFKDAQFNTQAPDWDAAKKITDTLAAAGLKIVGLYGYYNVVDPDEKRRKVGEANMRFLIENWQRLGSPVISTETGTFNPKSPWAESPENETEKGYLACRAAFEKMVKAAEQTGAVIAIECYWRNIIGTIDRAERLLSEINSPSLKLTMDPCNYFRKEDLSRMQPMLEEIFRRVGKQTVIAHAKDVKAADTGTELPAPGKGVLDYPLYLRLLAQLDREVYLAIEHLTLDDVPRARDFVLAQFDRI